MKNKIVLFREIQYKNIYIYLYIIVTDKNSNPNNLQEKKGSINTHKNILEKYFKKI